MQEELATVARVHYLGLGRLAEREATKDEWTSVKGNPLLAILALVTNRLEGAKLLESALRDAYDWCDSL